MTLFIEVHAIQTLGPGNVNRDDTGAPKTAMFGGVPRARVSSQAWKKVVRDTLKDELGDMQVGVRTKKIVEKLADALRQHNDAGVDDAVIRELAFTIALKAQLFGKDKDSEDAARKAFKEAEKKNKKNAADLAYPEAGALLLMGNKVFEQLEDFGINALKSDAPIAYINNGDNTKGIEAIPVKDHAIDIALFGRMNASNPGLNVDASCQFAHAISVDRFDMESDFFTAFDEFKNREETLGAGMIGNTYFGSSTLYRYASVDVEALKKKITNPDKPEKAVEATAKTVRAFIDAFALSLPAGKRHSFNTSMPPVMLLVTVRDTQNVNLVDAFSTPISDAPIAVNAAKALAAKEQSYEDAWGLKPLESWIVFAGDEPEQVKNVFGKDMPLNKLLGEVEKYVKGHVA